MANESKKLMVDVVARIDKLEKAMTKAAGVTDRQMGRVESRAKTMVVRVDKQFAGLAKSIGGVGKAFLGGLAGGAFIGGIEGLARGVRSVLSELTNIGDVASKVGLTTDALQQLRHVASLAGVETGTLDTAMQRFSRRVAEAANGSGVLRDILKANNVQLRNADGSMRSQVDILRDYANLIKNAGSEQERLLLAFKAFDSDGAALVNVFKDGATAIDTMRQKTEEAGGVIDEKLIKRAAELDAEWTKTWRNFEINAKSAIMGAINAMSGIRGAFDDYNKAVAGAELGRMAGMMAPAPGSVLTTGKRDQPGSLDVRMAGALSTELSAADQKLVEALQKRYGAAADKATIIPPPGKGDRPTRDAAAEKALREAEAVQKLIDNLSEELRLVGATDVERAKSNALRQAGTAATAEQQEEIKRLVEAIYSESEALEEAERAMENLRNVTHDTMGGFIQDMLDGKSATEALANTLKQLASQLINSGLNGLLGGIFGGGASKFTFPAGMGLWSEGGYTGPGPKNKPAGIVHAGEVVWSQDDIRKAGGVAAVEAMRKGMGGMAMPAISAPVMPKLSGMGGGGGNVTVSVPIHINAPGADSAALARVEQQVTKLQRDLPATVISTVRQMPQKNIR